MPVSPHLPPALARRLAPVCVAVSAASAEALFSQAAAALGESSFLELRLDALADPVAAVPLLRGFLAAHPGAAVLATCRRTAGGGAFTGSPAEQLALLQRCAEAGALLVDLELETLEVLGPNTLRQFHGALAAAGAFLLVSAHDFEGTGDLGATLDHLIELAAPVRPAIYKVVSTAQCLADNLRMLRFLEAAASRLALVGICMGQAGLVSRVLALAWDGCFTFASATGSSGTAPGQVPAATLLGLYRAASITRPAADGTGGTKFYGVAGNPVAHSLSPALHNAAFQAAAIDAVYLPLHTTSVEDLFTLTDQLPLAGLSVTMPWKVDILPWLNALDPLSASIGAVNTIVRQPDGTLFGTNTDVPAIVEPLGRRLPLPGARVLLLGAGGAARAAAFGLVAAGATVAILNRTESTARQLAQESGGQVADPRSFGGFDAVINATPAGMLGQEQQVLLFDLDPLPGGIPGTVQDALRGVRVVFEMVYRPSETPLTRLATSLGIDIIYGMEMFVEQGVRQWALWTSQDGDRDAKVAKARTAMDATLKTAIAADP